MGQLTLRPTGILKYEECPRLYWYSEVVRARTFVALANLLFGGAIDQAVKAFLRQWVGGPAVDALALFKARWVEAAARDPMPYTAQWTWTDFRDTGIRLIERLIEAWPRWGLTPLIDERGEPFMGPRLQREIAPGVVGGESVGHSGGAERPAAVIER